MWRAATGAAARGHSAIQRERVRVIVRSHAIGEQRDDAPSPGAGQRGPQRDTGINDLKGVGVRDGGGSSTQPRPMEDDRRHCIAGYRLGACNKGAMSAPLTISRPTVDCCRTQ